MYITMNRFKIKKGNEDLFIEMWRNRESRLHEMPGFMRFYFLKKESQGDYTLFSSYVEWQSKGDFENWLNSDQFKSSHQKKGDQPKQDIYVGPPEVECFEVLL